MAEKNYKVDEAIEIVYQAPNAESGLDIRADIYDEAKALFSVDNPLTEVSGTGTYRASFTPDAQGEWQAVIFKFVDSYTRDGQVTKRYSVGAHDVHSVGEKANSIQTAVAALPDAAGVNAEVDAALAEYDAPTKAEMDTKIDALNDIDAAGVNAEVDSALSDYDAPTKDELDTAQSAIQSDIANLDTKVSSLDTPPMVS